VTLFTAKIHTCCIFDFLSGRISKQIVLSLAILLHLEEKLLRNLVRKPFSKYCTYVSLALIGFLAFI
jgi:hypothetical protein